MNWFKGCRATEGHIMRKEDVIKNVLKKIDSKQDKLFELAMDELLHDGLMIRQADGVTLTLTAKGYDAL